MNGVKPFGDVACRRTVRIGPIAALALAVAVSGCSGNVSRFDFASALGGKKRSDEQLTTASLPPVPQEPVYDAEDRGQDPAEPDTAAPRATARAPSQEVARAPLPAARAQVEPASHEITLRRGDTLYRLSRRYNIPVDRIRTANNMTSNRLRAGQTLLIPTRYEPGSYTVQKGDSIYSIAHDHGLEHRQLASFNRLSRPDLIRPGQTLAIPRQTDDTTAQNVAGLRRDQVPIPRASPVRSDAPRVVRTHRIPVRTAEKTRVEPVRVASSSETVPIPDSSPRRQSPESSAPKPRAVAALKTLPEPAPLAGTRFRWPVRGRILSKFGPKPDGKHNDGINVAVPRGTSVKAAENGVVAYAGNELKGYGNLVLIRHADNWVSAYAHNDALTVKRGDTVTRGQIIAKAGTTGSIGKPQLHFELRKGSKPVDPLKYMADG